jgi:uncharacterized protein HemX
MQEPDSEEAQAKKEEKDKPQQGGTAWVAILALILALFSLAIQFFLYQFHKQTINAVTEKYQQVDTSFQKNLNSINNVLG